MNNNAVNSNNFIYNYASNLLLDLDVSTVLADLQDFEKQTSAVAWSQSGAMWLTGDKQPLFLSAPLATCARAVWLALRSVASSSMDTRLEGFDAAFLLAERAGYMGLNRLANTSAGGACRLLATADSYVAINMARRSDWLQLEALLCTDLELRGNDQFDWQQLTVALASQATSELLERGRLLGMAIAPAMGDSFASSQWLKRYRCADIVKQESLLPLVIDLSSLWAGPLCTHLLQKLGARVIKVESINRPDGARSGNRDFYNILNNGKQSVALDLKTELGVNQLKQLILQADIVVEGSRPRALRQLGIEAEQLLAAKPGLSWLSITGYGRDEPFCDWVAFGDDAGVGAGLSAQLYRQYGKWLFCGDAIADPLAGLHAALAAWVSWDAGGGQLLDVSLCGVTTHCIKSASDKYEIPLHESKGGFFFKSSGQDYQVQQPTMRTVDRLAPELGVDNEAIFLEFKIAC